MDLKEHVTSYTCAIKGNNLEDDEIELVLLKRFGETLLKGAMIWYHNLTPNSINLFAMLVDAFVKAHVGAIKVETKKSDLFKWQLKQDLVEYLAVTFVDVHNRYQSKIRVEGDQLGAPSRSIYPIRTNDRSRKVIDHEPRPSRDRYQTHNRDRRGNISGRHPTGDEKRNDRGLSSRGLMSKNGFDKPFGAREAPRLSKYNFSVDTASIVFAIRCIKDAKWPRPLQSEPTQRDPNLMCKYHDTHGHRTEYYRQLREEVARLFNNGHI
uniref:Uncharacterized protein LOC104242986 n=1 Tax=Nicotiana sylvestris TaxID=4096 RepID=A0A1U7XWK5_NICSY|nr:PREDICTED: uncharacterized protein LOC104242986 [Nicotiana sylvestris]